MAESLKNLILYDIYLDIFPKFIKYRHLYNTLSNRLQYCLSKNISHHKDIFKFLGKMRKNLSKFSKLIEITHGTSKSKCP